MTETIFRNLAPNNISNTNSFNHKSSAKACDVGAGIWGWFWCLLLRMYGMCEPCTVWTVLAGCAISMLSGDWFVDGCLAIVDVHVTVTTLRRVNHARLLVGWSPWCCSPHWLAVLDEQSHVPWSCRMMHWLSYCQQRLMNQVLLRKLVDAKYSPTVSAMLVTVCNSFHWWSRNGSRHPEKYV